MLEVLCVGACIVGAIIFVGFFFNSILVADKEMREG